MMEVRGGFRGCETIERNFPARVLSHQQREPGFNPARKLAWEREGLGGCSLGLDQFRLGRFEQFGKPLFFGLESWKQASERFNRAVDVLHTLSGLMIGPAKSLPLDLANRGRVFQRVSTPAEPLENQFITDTKRGNASFENLEPGSCAFLGHLDSPAIRLFDFGPALNLECRQLGVVLFEEFVNRFPLSGQGIPQTALVFHVGLRE